MHELNLLAAKEVAAILRVHVNQVYKLAIGGELRSVKVGGRRMFFEEDVVGYLETHQTPVQARDQSELCTDNAIKMAMHEVVVALQEGHPVEPDSDIARRLLAAYDDSSPSLTTGAAA